MPSHICIIFIILSVGAIEYVKAATLEDFVKTQMANYSTWLKQHNRDPAPIQSGPDHFRAATTGDPLRLNLDWDIRNHSLEGHSDGYVFKYMEGHTFFKYFTVGWTVNTSVTFYGNYSANGSLTDVDNGIEIPITTSGEWHITSPNIELYGFRIWYDVSPSGHLNLTRHKLDGISIVDNAGGEAYFENMWDHGQAANYQEYLKLTMYNVFGAHLNYEEATPEYPIRALYLQYWREVLSETTLEDISG